MLLGSTARRLLRPRKRLLQCERHFGGSDKVFNIDAERNTENGSATATARKKNAIPPILRKKEGVKDQVINDRYEAKHLLGRGRFGLVKLAVDMKDPLHKHVALKFISRNVDIKVVETELQVLRRLQAINKDNPTASRYCTVPFDIFQWNNQHVLALEYLWGGDLFDRIMVKGYVEETNLRPVMRQVIEALQLLHSNGIIHRDVKPENILFRVKNKVSTAERPFPEDKNQAVSWDNVEAVLCDFGLSFLEGAPDHIEPPAGTFGYASPQMLNLERRSSQACDVWSLGVMMFACLGGELPFPASTDGSTTLEAHLGEAYRGPKFLSHRWSVVSQEARDLISEMLHYSPYNRIPINHILHHPWFAMDA